MGESAANTPAPGLNPAPGWVSIDSLAVSWELLKRPIESSIYLLIVKQNPGQIRLQAKFRSGFNILARHGISHSLKLPQSRQGFVAARLGQTGED
jgi:hypothetical protein